MDYNAPTVADYLNQLPVERQEPMRRLYETIRASLPTGFGQTMSYNMLSFVVPKSIYPPGYHVKTEEPLLFLSLASQKNFIALYHMGLYGSKELFSWFQEEYPKHSKRKLDMGKSCIRFKYMDDIPYQLIAELCTKITVEAYIQIYESGRLRPS